MGRTIGESRARVARPQFPISQETLWSALGNKQCTFILGMEVPPSTCGQVQWVQLVHPATVDVMLGYGIVAFPNNALLHRMLRLMELRVDIAAAVYEEVWPSGGNLVHFSTQLKTAICVSVRLI